MPITVSDAKDWLFMMAPERSHNATALYEYIKWLEKHLCPADVADCRKAAEEYANATDDDGDAWDGGT